MKISFDDRSYIEVSLSNNPGKVHVTVAAISADDSKKLIANSVEISVEDFLKLTKLHS